jgi:hypothetical protein
MKILEISKDENSVVTDYGKATFKPVKRMKRTHCLHCWLFVCIDGCEGVPCGYGKPYRSDGLTGVFTIQQMPVKKLRS